MMKKHINLFQKVFILMGITVLSYSCSNDKDETPEADFALNATDLQAVLETDVILGAADNLLTSLYAQEGINGKSDTANDCYDYEATATGYKLTFVTCRLDGRDVRGVIEVAYDRESVLPTFTATYTDFFIDGIQLDGTRTFLIDGETNGNNLSFSVTSDVGLVFADGTLASEQGTRYFGFIIAGTRSDIAVTLNGDWNLTLGDDVYTATITEILKTKLSCDYISEGIISLDKNGLTAVVDFGNGSCDASAILTYPNGTTQPISLED